MNQINSIYLLLILFFLSSCQKNETATQPNVVIILADDQGWGDLSMNGNPLVQTSNIDAIAQSGIVLDNFYVNSVCSPTRAEMLTGRYHVRGGVYSTSQGGERLDLDENTIAEVFQKAGYRTGAFGKWHNGMQPPYHPNARGFDEFYGYCSGHWGSYFDAMLEHNGSIVESKGYLTDVLTRRMIDFISKKTDEPFFAYLPLNTPHSPMQVPDRWFDKFKNVKLPQHRYSEQEDVEKTKAAYAMVENIDWNVGQVVEALDSLGQMDNTIIIYFSDNGPNGNRWNKNMKGRKGQTDEGGVRSPFVIKWGDKISGGKKIKTIAHAIDLFPTLVDLANVNISNENVFDGISLADVLLEKNEKPTNRILYSYWSGGLSLRNQQFRLDKNNQLFDMEKDLEQKNNVAEKYPEEYKMLTTAKLNWEREVLSELPKLDTRTFPVGDPNFSFTQLPARDAKTTGEIIRSNRWPNCSFYTNWKNETDSIYWEVEVLEEGEFQPTIYYTCAEENMGHTIHFSNSKNSLESKVVEVAFNPPLRGMEHDRIPRGESFVKDWAQLKLDNIQLEKGLTRLSLTASDFKGIQGIDFRMMILERVK